MEHDQTATPLADAKAALRQQARARRAEAWCRLGPSAADAALQSVLERCAAPGAVLAAYVPIKDEASPLAALTRHPGPTCLPVVVARGAALQFRSWAPGDALERGPLGTSVPAAGAWQVPDILIVPMLAFDRRLCRLGYGGGYYDRTLAAIRAEKRCLAIGLAFAAQEVPEVPVGPHDARLDLIVTETGAIQPA